MMGYIAAAADVLGLDGAAELVDALVARGVVPPPELAAPKRRRR